MLRVNSYDTLTCNNNNGFTAKVKIFAQKLQQREYEESEITQIIKEIDHTKQGLYLTNKDKNKDKNRKQYTTQYIITKDMKRALTANWRKIENYFSFSFP